MEYLPGGRSILTPPRSVGDRHAWYTGDPGDVTRRIERRTVDGRGPRSFRNGPEWRCRRSFLEVPRWPERRDRRVGGPGVVLRRHRSPAEVAREVVAPDHRHRPAVHHEFVDAGYGRLRDAQGARQATRDLVGGKRVPQLDEHSGVGVRRRAVPLAARDSALAPERFAEHGGGLLCGDRPSVNALPGRSIEDVVARERENGGCPRGQCFGGRGQRRRTRGRSCLTWLRGSGTPGERQHRDRGDDDSCPHTPRVLRLPGLVVTVRSRCVRRCRAPRGARGRPPHRRAAPGWPARPPRA